MEGVQSGREKGRIQAGEPHMRISVCVVAVSLSGVLMAAQEPKPVPEDSVRVFVPGCTKGQVFTAGPFTEDQPVRSASIPPGMHLRMQGPRQTMSEIRAREGSRIEITGLVRKGQLVQDGVRVGPVRITPGPGPSGGSGIPSPGAGQVVIDVEGWRRLPGDCPWTTR